MSSQSNISPSIPWRKLSVRQVVKGCALYGLYRTLRLLPIDLCSGMGAFFGKVIGPRLRHANSCVRKNIAALRPEASKGEQEQLARRYWSHIGRIVAEFAALQRIWKSDRIEICGRENYEKAKATGRPLVGLSIHTGNYDLVSQQIIDTLHYSGFQIYGEHANIFVKKITDEIRSPYKEYLLSEKDPFALEKIYSGLLEGRGFLTALDDSTRSYPLLGRAIPGGSNLKRAIKMARRTNALLIPVYCLRKKGARFALHVLPPIDLDFTDFNDEKLAEAINHVDQLMGSIVRQHVDQWYWICRELGLDQAT